MRPRAIKYFVNVALLVSVVVLVLGLLEFGIRVVFPIYDPSGHVKFFQLSDGTPIGPTNRILRQVKNTGDYDVEVRFNALGFRDDKPLTAAIESDLFLVGDSFAFGWGVEMSDRFSDRLQKILNRPVFNIAVPGADFDGYHGLMRYARANGVVIKKLIISVTMENDLRVYGAFPDSALLKRASSFKARLPESISQLRDWFGERSALYVMATHAVHKTPWLREIAVRFGLLIPNLDGIRALTEDTESALRKSTLRLHQLASGVDAVVLIIPSRRLWVGESAERGEAELVHAAFIHRLRSTGLTVVDMRERFELRGNPVSYHFANDGHWNKQGHQLAAEALADVLVQD